MATTRFYKRNKDLSPLENQVGQALLEIESTTADLKGFLVSKAVEVPVCQDKKEKPAIIVFVPFHLVKLLHANYKKLSVEFEKKLKTVVLLVVTRTIQSRWIKLRKSQIRPFSRTLTAVHEAILDDLVLPANIIGKRTRVRLDGSSFLKVTLDKAEQHNLEDRVPAIKAAYKLLTTRNIEIDFAQDPTYHTLRTSRK